MRKPTVAGQFYPADPAKLRTAIEHSFREGYGKLPVPVGEPKEQSSFTGIVAPHAGYPFSGDIASYSYGYLLEKGFPDVVVLLGLHHYPLPEYVFVAEEDFQTPLGIVKNNRELGAKIVKGPRYIRVSERAHAKEHSLEVQLPFLQYLAPKEFDFVPVGFARQDLKTARTVGKHLAKVIKEYSASTGKKVAVIASSDFSHVGPSYGYVPIVGTGETIVNWMKQNDGQAMELIANLELEEFYKLKLKKGLTICGYMAIMTLMEMCRERGFRKGEILNYNTSFTRSKNPRGIVGYGAIGFRD